MSESATAPALSLICSSSSQMNDNVFTIILDFKGGTYVRQVSRPTPQNALIAWAQELSDSDTEAMGLDRAELVGVVGEEDRLVPVERCSSVWRHRGNGTHCLWCRYPPGPHGAIRWLTHPRHHRPCDHGHRPVRLLVDRYRGNLHCAAHQHNRTRQPPRPRRRNLRPVAFHHPAGYIETQSDTRITSGPRFGMRSSRNDSTAPRCA